MSWPPKTWVNDVLATAAEFNEFVRDPLNDLDQHKHTGAVGDGDKALGPMATANFVDQAASPAVDGRLQRNGAGLEYYDGATAIAIGKADQAAAVASPRTLGTGATQAAAGNHTHTLSEKANSAAETDGTEDSTEAVTISRDEISTTEVTFLNDQVFGQAGAGRAIILVIQLVQRVFNANNDDLSIRLYENNVQVAEGTSGNTLGTFANRSLRVTRVHTADDAYDVRVVKASAGTTYIVRTAGAQADKQGIKLNGVVVGP